MVWAKTKNPWSEDASDPAAEENLIATSMVGGAWGTVPASSKELDASERIMAGLIQEAIRAHGPSGWYRLGALSFPGGANTFRMALSSFFTNGYPGNVVGTALASDTDNSIVLNAPPVAGTRDDLVFLEVWLAEVPGSTTSVPTGTHKPSTATLYKYGNVQYGGTNPTDDINEVDLEIRRRIQLQYRIRVVDGVNFTTFPDGVNDPIVVAQGAASTLSALQYAIDPVDTGLYVAGNGSVSNQGTLESVAGKSWALPIARVARTAGDTTVEVGEVIDLRTLTGQLRNVATDGSNAMSGNLTISTPGGSDLTLDGSGNNVIELGRVDGVASTPSIDFHAGATPVDYDARLSCDNPNGVIGQAWLNVDGQRLQLASTSSLGLISAQVSAAGAIAYVIASDLTNSVDTRIAAGQGVGWVGTQSNHALGLVANGTTYYQLTTAGDLQTVGGKKVLHEGFVTPVPKVWIAGDTLTEPHGLTDALGAPARPTRLGVLLECQANENGYVVGEVLQAGVDFNLSGPTIETGVAISATATDVSMVVGENGIDVLHKTLNTKVSLSPANWRLIATAGL